MVLEGEEERRLAEPQMNFRICTLPFYPRVIWPCQRFLKLKVMMEAGNGTPTRAVLVNGFCFWQMALGT